MNLKIRNLSKRYPNGHRALKGLNLELGAGTTGLLGPNGAGKTTTLSILATTSPASAGEVLVDGKPMDRVLTHYRRRLGYLPQYFELPPLLEVHEVVEFFGGLLGLSDRQSRERGQGCLQDVGLWDVRHRKVKHLSVGMQRRLGIAQTLLGDPDLLLVDEPTAGLDPEERNRFCALIARLGREKTILLSTHIVSDIEATCSRVVVLDEGCSVYEGSPRGFVEKAEGKVGEVEIPSEELEALARRCHIASMREDAGTLRIRVVYKDDPPAQCAPCEPTFEDAYLYVFRVAKGLPPGPLWLAEREAG